MGEDQEQDHPWTKTPFEYEVACAKKTIDPGIGATERQRNVKRIRKASIDGRKTRRFRSLDIQSSLFILRP